MNKEEFLKLISMLETSGGQNLEHKEIKHGIHKGDTAIGSYGLMPNTIQEIVKREQKRGPLEEALTEIAKKDPNFIKQYFLDNPDSESIIAGKLVDKIGLENPEKSAYMWNRGHNIDPNDITDDKLDNSEYVKRFRMLMNPIGKAD